MAKDKQPPRSFPVSANLRMTVLLLLPLKRQAVNPEPHQSTTIPGSDHEHPRCAEIHDGRDVHTAERRPAFSAQRRNRHHRFSGNFLFHSLPLCETLFWTCLLPCSARYVGVSSPVLCFQMESPKFRQMRTRRDV